MENKNIEKWREDFIQSWTSNPYYHSKHTIEMSENNPDEFNEQSTQAFWLWYKEARQKAQNEPDHWHKTHSHIINGLTEEKKQIVTNMRAELEAVKAQLERAEKQTKEFRQLVIDAYVIIFNAKWNYDHDGSEWLNRVKEVIKKEAMNKDSAPDNI